MKRTALIVIGCALFCARGVARADVTLVYDLETHLPTESSGEAKCYLTDGRLALVTEGARPSRVIYWDEAKRIAIIDDAEKTYVEFDKKSIEELGQTMDDTAELLEKTMSELSPEQQEMLKKMVGNAAGGASDAVSKAHAEVRATGETKTLKGYSCRRYDVLIGDSKTGTIWATPPGKQQVTKEETATFVNMAGLMRSLTESMKGVTDIFGIDLSSLDMVGGALEATPVHAESFQGSDLRSELDLKSLDRGDLPKTLFEIGKGYTKQN